MPHFLSMHSKTSSPPLFLTCACFLMFGMLEQGTTSASVYLLTSFLGVPLQLTMDKGSEVGEMANCQEILRYILRFFSHLDECSHPLRCTACMLLLISPSMLGQPTLWFRANITLPLKGFGDGNDQEKDIVFVKQSSLGRPLGFTTALIQSTCK